MPNALAFSVTSVTSVVQLLFGQRDEPDHAARKEFVTDLPPESASPTARRRSLYPDDRDSSTSALRAFARNDTGSLRQ